MADLLGEYEVKVKATGLPQVRKQFDALDRELEKKFKKIERDAERQDRLLQRIQQQREAREAREAHRAGQILARQANNRAREEMRWEREAAKDAVRVRRDKDRALERDAKDYARRQSNERKLAKREQQAEEESARRDREKLKSEIKGVAGFVEKAFVTAASSVAALTMAGFSGTVTGNRMAIAWKELSRELASVFQPAADAVIRKINHIRDAFRGLSEEQQDALMNKGIGLLGAYAGYKIATNPVLAAGAAGIGIAGMEFTGSQLDSITRKANNRLTRIRSGDVDTSEFNAVARMAGITKNMSGDERRKRAGELKAQIDEEIKREWDSQGFFDSLWDSMTGGEKVSKSAKKVAELSARSEIAGQIFSGDLTEGKPVLGPGVDKKRRDMLPAMGGFEGVAETYARIQQAISERDDPQANAMREQTDVMSRIAANVEAIMNNQALGQPLVGGGPIPPGGGGGRAQMFPGGMVPLPGGP